MIGSGMPSNQSNAPLPKPMVSLPLNVMIGRTTAADVPDRSKKIRTTDLLVSQDDAQLLGEFVAPVWLVQYWKSLVRYFGSLSLTNVSGRQKYLKVWTKSSSFDCELCAVHAAGHHYIREHDINSGFAAKVSQCLFRISRDGHAVVQLLQAFDRHSQHLLVVFDQQYGFAYRCAS